MKFVSTRGGVKGCTFEEGLFSPGYQADGGLLLPEKLPSLSSEDLRRWTSLRFTDLAKEILSLFIDEEEIPRNDLNDIVEKAYAKFPHKELIKIASLSGSLNIQEMFLGGTLAFKDLSTYVVAELFSYFLQRKNKHAILLVGTSGDTGASCLEAVKGVKGIYIIVLLPSGRISEIQERSMTSVHGDNIQVFAVDGSSDDLDAPIKMVSLDQDFRQRHNLCTMNSISIGRILCQMTAIFYAYLQMCPECDREVEIILPTGAAGNLTSGCIARSMGLPVRFVCSVNKNDIMYRFLTAGDLSVKDEVVTTLSPAIDIQNPYNVERILWLFSGQNTELVKQLTESFESEGKVQIPDTLMKKINECVTSYRCSDDEIVVAMQRCWQENGYLVCPHTAVAVSYHYHKQSLPEGDVCRDRTSVCFATASPAKFPEAVVQANLTPVSSPEVERWLSMPTRSERMNVGENWEQMIREKVEEFTSHFTSKLTGEKKT